MAGETSDPTARLNVFGPSRQESDPDASIVKGTLRTGKSGTMICGEED